MKAIIGCEILDGHFDVTIEIDQKRNTSGSSAYGPSRGSHVTLTYDIPVFSGRVGTPPQQVRMSFDAAELLHAIRSVAGPK